MRLYRRLALGASLLVLAGACTTGGGGTSGGGGAAGGGSPGAAEKPTIRIGSAGFTESRLMAEIYAQALEAKGYRVERKLGLGARTVSQPALESAQIDMMPEYIGSLLGYYDKTKPTGEAAENARLLQEVLTAKGLTVLAYTPAQDQNGFVVRRETAEKYGLRTMSDLAKVTDTLKWGLPPECKTNPLCAPALKESYGIEPTSITPLEACSAQIATALNEKAIDVAELCTTQPDIARFDFVLLEDDKQSQPAENIAPLVRDEYLAKVDAEAFKKILNDESKQITTEALTCLGVKVAVEQQSIADVAKDWLANHTCSND